VPAFSVAPMVNVTICPEVFPPLTDGSVPLTVFVNGSTETDERSKFPGKVMTNSAFPDVQA